MKRLAFICCGLILTSCLVMKDEDPPPLEPTVTLELSSESIRLGESVSIEWTTHHVDYCSLTANSEAAQIELNLTGSPTHSPEETTTYRLQCQDAHANVVASEATVTVLQPGEVLVTLESLGVISKAFPLDELKEIACAGIENCQLEDFKTEREFDLVLPDSKVLYVSASDVALSIDKSVLYGLENRHDFDSYREQCELAFSLNEGDNPFPDQVLSQLFEAGEEQVKKSRDHSLVHLQNFRAVTKSFEDELPAGTGFDVSFELSTSEVSFASQYEDFGELSGNYTMDMDVTLRNDRRQPPNTVIVDSYQLPLNSIKKIPGTDHFDPNDALCNYRGVYQSCEPGSDGRPNCFWIEAQRLENVVPTKSSLRVVSGPGEVQCNSLFPALAREYNLGSAWKTRYDHVQWFVTDNRWPSCGGYNCTNKVQRAGAADDRFQNIEPYQNFCVDRWKDTNWTTYQNSLQAACMDTEVFKIAKAAKEERNAIAQFVQACSPGTECYAALIAMKELNKGFELGSLEKVISDTEKSYDKAFQNGEGYLISNDDLIFSKIIEISSLVNTVIQGSAKIDQLLRSTKADWNRAQFEITGIDVMLRFESAAARNETIKNYQSLLERAETLSEPYATKIACDYKATGRFRKYLKNDIKDVRQVGLDNGFKSLFLRSLSDLKADR
ncbi:MAG: hypothetical protein ACOH5I_26685 [Oligoflexus sp.]